MDSKKFWLVIKTDTGTQLKREFNQPIVTIGRSQESDLVINSPNVSRNHARLSQTANGILIEDMQSTNGTYVNEKGISSPTLLNDGDTLRIGEKFTCIFYLVQNNVITIPEMNTYDETMETSEFAVVADALIEIGNGEARGEADTGKAIGEGDIFSGLIDPFNTDDATEQTRDDASRPQNLSSATKIENEPSANPHTQTPPAPQPKVSIIPEARNLAEPHELIHTLDAFPLIKTQHRMYCIGGLRLLDPQDPDPKYRTFVQCQTCKGLYHETTWNSFKKCIHCGGTQVEKVQISSPKPLRVIEKRIPIPPRTAIYSPSRPNSLKPRDQEISTALKIFAQNLLYLFRSNLVRVLMIALIVLVSVYAYRIIFEVSRKNVQSILDAVLRTQRPPDNHFIVGLVATLCATYVFYPIQLTNAQGYSSPMRRMVRLLAVLELLVIYNILIFRWHLLPITEWEFRIREQIKFDDPFLFIQGAAIALVFLSIPIYRVMTRRPQRQENPTPVERFKFTKSLIALIRFLAVSGALVMLTAVATNTNIFSEIIREASSLRTSLSLSRDEIFQIALVIGALVAVIVYYPPQYRAFKARTLTFRFMVFLGLLVVGGLIYASSHNTSSLIVAAAIAGSLTFGFLPIQRAFS